MKIYDGNGNWINDSNFSGNQNDSRSMAEKLIDRQTALELDWRLQRACVYGDSQNQTVFYYLAAPREARAISKALANVTARLNQLRVPTTVLTAKAQARMFILASQKAEALAKKLRQFR